LSERLGARQISSISHYELIEEIYQMKKKSQKKSQKKSRRKIICGIVMMSAPQNAQNLLQESSSHCTRTIMQMTM
jgi:hypothetical protein